MKYIPLTQGQFAIVDDQDFDALNKYKWFASKEGKTFYAGRNIQLPNGKRTTIQMHRSLLGLTDPNVCADHRDGNGLNNQRSNLRACAKGENNRNTSKRNDNTSGYKGVSLCRRNGMFAAKIQTDRKDKHIGYFACPIEAAKAYDEAAKIHHGEFARLNFPV